MCLHWATCTADDSGWVEYSRGSLNGSKYIVIDKSMTFYGAQDQCRKYGGYLAHVNTIREQVFLEEFLVQELQLDGKCSCSMLFACSIFIGRYEQLAVYYSFLNFENGRSIFGEDMDKSLRLIFWAFLYIIV